MNVGQSKSNMAIKRHIGTHATDETTEQRRRQQNEQAAQRATLEPNATPQDFNFEQLTAKLKAEGREDELKEIEAGLDRGVQVLIRQYQQRIQEVCDLSLEKLGHTFKTDKQQDKFWKRRVTRSTDEKGVEYFVLDAEKKPHVLCWCHPKTLRVGTIENQ